MAEADIQGDAARKVLLGEAPTGETGGRPRSATAAVTRDRLETDPENAADDLVRLVLALVETVRQVVERQAIRRVESGRLSEEDIERLGLTLLGLEERMTELKQRFGMEQEDLSLRFATVRDLVDVLESGDLAEVPRRWAGEPPPSDHHPEKGVS